MNISTLITDSGIFGFIIVAYALFTAGAIVFQFLKAETKDFSQVLWGLIAGLLAMGVLATAIGQMEACAAYLTREEATSDWLVMAWRISLGPVVLSTLCATIFSIATGVAATRARRFAASR
jgi:hypothetical protein